MRFDVQHADRQSASLVSARDQDEAFPHPHLCSACPLPHLSCVIYRVGTERYHLSAVNALLLAALSPALRHRSSDPWFVFPTFDAATPDVERFTQACSSGAHSSLY